VIGSACWIDVDGARSRPTFQVATIRDGRIVDLQDTRTRHAAERYARRS
jgi:hypothetical protein